MEISLEIPADLEEKLKQRSIELNISLETLILDSLSELIAEDPDDTAKEEVLKSLRASLEDARGGRSYEIAQLWEGIDDRSSCPTRPK